MPQFWNSVSKLIYGSTTGSSQGAKNTSDSATGSSHGIRAPIVPTIGCETPHTVTASATNSHDNKNINGSATGSSHGDRAPIVPAMGSKTPYIFNASAMSSHYVFGASGPAPKSKMFDSSNASATSSHYVFGASGPAPKSEMFDSSNASATGNSNTQANEKESPMLAAAQALKLLSQGAYRHVSPEPMLYPIRIRGKSPQPCRPYGLAKRASDANRKAVSTTPPTALAETATVSESTIAAATPKPHAKRSSWLSVVLADTSEAPAKATTGSDSAIHTGTLEPLAKDTGSNATTIADTPEVLADTTSTTAASNRNGPRKLKLTFKGHNLPSIAEELSTDGTATYTQTAADGSTETKKYGGTCPRRVCGWSFKSKSHLKRHMETCGNPDYKPYWCPVPKCNYQCSRRDNLRQHIENIHPTLVRGVRQEELDEVRKTLAKKGKANGVDVLLQRTAEDWKRALTIVVKLQMPKRKREETDSEEEKDPKVVRVWYNYLGWTMRDVDDRTEVEKAADELFKVAVAAKD